MLVRDVASLSRGNHQLVRNLWHQVVDHAQGAGSKGQLESGFANLSGSKRIHSTPREGRDVTYGTINKATAGGKSAV